MRRLICLTAAILPGLALAQDLGTARLMMDGAMSELSSHSKVTLILDGTEQDGNKQHKFTAVLALSFMIQDGRQLAQMELLDFKNDQLIARQAGDGDRFWNYDVKSKVYSSTEYGTARHAGKEKERLFQNMLRTLRGDQTFLGRLAQDAFGGKMDARTSWLPWRPNASVVVEGDNIVCSSKSPTPNSLTYSLYRVPGFGWALQSASYFEESVISGRNRTTQWTVTVYRDSLPEGTSWQFVPPAGSRAVAVNEIGG